MDDGKGKFVDVPVVLLARNDDGTIDTKVPHIFHVGEELTIKDSRFRLTKIKRKDIVLRLLPRLKEKL